MFDGDDKNSTLIGTYCGKNDVKPSDFVTTHNYLYFEFTTDSSVSGTGFMANYSSIDKGSFITILLNYDMIYILTHFAEYSFGHFVPGEKEQNAVLYDLTRLV